jgi:outer membrane receptor protein involved in Fe transport
VLRGDDLANFLRQLPGNLLERVEVVPNPSDRYAPAGMGGIVNVVLKKNADLGTSGSFTVSAGTSGRYGGNASLGYGRGPLTLTASYGLNHDSRDSERSNFRENRLQDPVTFLTGREPAVARHH